MELLEYLLILRRRKGIIIVLFITAVLSATVASYIATPIYQASTSVLVKPQSETSSLPFDMGGLMGDLGKNEIQNYVEVLKSRFLAERVAQDLQIDIVTQPDELKSLRNSITIQPVQGTDAIRINVQSTDPAEARDAANSLVREFRKWCELRNKQEASNARAFIESQLPVQQRALNDVENELRQWRANQKVVAPDEQVRAQVATLSDLEAQRAQAQIEVKAAQLQLREMNGQLSRRDKTLISQTTLQKDPRLVHYETQLMQLESDLLVAREKYKDGHPKVQELLSQIEGVKKELNKNYADVAISKIESVNPLYTSLLGDIAQTQGTITSLKAKVLALDGAISLNEQKLSQMPSKELRYAQLLRDQSVAEKIYVLLKEKLAETSITEAQTTAQVDVLDEAILPDMPIKPKKKLNVAIAAFLGLFVGCGIAFMLEYMDTSIKTPDDITRYLELPIMGTIPLLKETTPKRGTRERHRSNTRNTAGTTTTDSAGGVDVG